jgi:hypothetical protein
MTNVPGDDPQQPPYQPPQGQPWSDQGYGQPGYPPAPGYGMPPAYGAPRYYAVPDHPSATTAMVLGILSVVCCGILAPFAWMIGARAVREIDASRGQLAGRGQAMAGKVLGIIGTILLILGLVYLAVVVVVGVSGEFDEPVTYQDAGAQ